MEKQEKIVEMFNEIAPTYDKANRVISFGVDTSWRKKSCEMVLKKFKNQNINIVDVACGTGDMMGTWANLSPKFGVKIDSLIGVDPSTGMLEVAKEKFKDFKFITASATDTTLPSEVADILSISYGIRNVVEIDKALVEFNRVLKPGGYLVVLEFTKSRGKNLVFKARDFYVNKILPSLGGFVSKNREAYEYLPSSIGSFLDTDEFAKKLENSGFELEISRGFSFDVTTLFVAKKVR